MTVYRWTAVSISIAYVAATACNPQISGDRMPPEGAGSGGTESGGTGGSGARGGSGGTGEGGSGNRIDAGDDSGKGDACAAHSADVTPTPPILQFAVDISGSMLWDVTNEEADPGESTKWDLSKTAMAQAINAMPETMALGMSFFPNTSGTAPCIVNEIAVPIDWLGATQKALVETAMAAKTPIGGTPTHDAWVFGHQTAQASPLLGRKFILLITDGAPTYSRGCVQPPDQMVFRRDVAAALGADNIGTFVLGAPGSQGGGTGPNPQPDARSNLSHLAEAGGTAPRDPTTGVLTCSHVGPNYCHFDMTQSTDLTQALIDALKRITTVLIDSVLDVPPPPIGEEIDPDTIEVIYIPNGSDPNTGDAGSLLIPRSGPPCTDGWWFTDATQTKVELCGSWLTLVQADPKAKLIVRYDCKDIPTRP